MSPIPQIPIFSTISRVRRVLAQIGPNQRDYYCGMPNLLWLDSIPPHGAHRDFVQTANHSNVHSGHAARISSTSVRILSGHPCPGWVGGDALCGGKSSVLSFPPRNVLLAAGYAPFRLQSPKWSGASALGVDLSLPHPLKFERTGISFRGKIVALAQS